MPGRIFVMNGDSGLTAMEAAPYDSESLLQQLLARYPDLLAGEQINSDEPRRWLLITREMTVRGEAPESPRWSLDHLFLDQDAVPTLVEVKQSSNPEIRRKVIGQMLDYAANAVAYWPVEEVRARFKTRCERDGEDPDRLLTILLGEEKGVDDFWQQVKTNLQAGRIRMVFLADTIPAELRRVVEFLNQQMDPAEVLAIEVRQFVGDKIKAFVPRVFGQSETARQKKGPGISTEGHWDEKSFLRALEQTSGAACREAAEDILHWIAPQVTRVWYGKGPTEGGLVPCIERGGKQYHICRMTTRGGFAFRFDWLCRKPQFSDDAVRRQLLARINQIPQIAFGEEVLTRQALIPFEKLTDTAASEHLKAALAWLIEQVKAFPNEG